MLVKTKTNQLTFVDGRFYHDEDGNYFPSATTLLEAYPKPYQLIQWMKEMGSKADEIRDSAGRRGSTVHQLTEDYDHGFDCNLLDSNGKPKFSLEEWNMFERYVEFSDIHNPKHLYIEQTIVSNKLKFAGTMDRVSIINGKRYLIDIKTSNGIFNNYWLQLAAYRKLLLEIDKQELDGVAILWLNAKTRTYGKEGVFQGPGWQLIIQEDSSKEWELFEAVQKLWNAEHANDKPREFSYKLSHKKDLTC